MSCIRCNLVAKLEEKSNPKNTFCDEACQLSYYGLIGVQVERMDDKDEEESEKVKKFLVVKNISKIGRYSVDNHKAVTLFLGGHQGNEAFITRLNITTVISIRDSSDIYQKKVKLHNLYMYDKAPTTKEDIEKVQNVLITGSELITEGLKSGNVYVHCDAGQNRSVALIVYWLVSNRMVESVNDAYAYLVYRRPFITDNSNKRQYNFRDFLISLFHAEPVEPNTKRSKP